MVNFKKVVNKVQKGTSNAKKAYASWKISRNHAEAMKLNKLTPEERERQLAHDEAKKENKRRTKQQRIQKVKNAIKDDYGKSKVLKPSIQKIGKPGWNKVIKPTGKFTWNKAIKPGWNKVGKPLVKKTIKAGKPLVKKVLKPSLIKVYLALIVLFIDFNYFGFNRTSGTLVNVALLYLALSVIYAIWAMFDSESADFRTFLQVFGISMILSGLQIAIPYLVLRYVPEWTPRFVGGMLFITLMASPWLIYWIHINKITPPPLLIKIIRIGWTIIFIGGLLIFFMAGIITTLGDLGASQELPLTPKEAITDFKFSIGDELNNLRQLINNTKNQVPGVKGEIDKNSKTRLGVFFDNLRILEDPVYENQEFNMLGLLEVNTVFNPTEIATKCYIEKNEKGKPKELGIMPQNYFEVFGQNLELLECKFNGLERGIYRTYFEANFDFDTWAYIDYTFVDTDLIKQYYFEGKDINKELNIEKETIPVYTDGPVKILMIAAKQPTSYSVDRTTLPKIGIELKKNFKTGEISVVDKIVIQTPKMISLDKNSCTYKGVSLKLNNTELKKSPFDEIERKDNYNFYAFVNPDEDAGALKTIVCSMSINDTAYNKEKNINPKLVKTIVVYASYRYKTISSPVGVIVETNPFQ
jgi:hypothetical protein